VHIVSIFIRIGYSASITLVQTHRIAPFLPTVIFPFLHLVLIQVPAYLQRCEEALTFEKDLAARYLHNRTEPQLRACLEECLLAELQV